MVNHPKPYSYIIIGIDLKVLGFTEEDTSVQNEMDSLIFLNLN